jgi:hypothetical protein
MATIGSVNQPMEAPGIVPNSGQTVVPNEPCREAGAPCQRYAPKPPSPPLCPAYTLDGAFGWLEAINRLWTPAAIR